MSKLLEQAIERVRESPEGDQDVAAAETLGVLSDFATARVRVALAERQSAFERGDFVTLDQLRHEMGIDSR